MSKQHRDLAEYFARRARLARKPQERARFEQIAMKYRSLDSEAPERSKSSNKQRAAEQDQT